LRKRWGSEFPFAWLQLPNLASPDNRWPLMREQMLNVPKTGMAISIDIGDKLNGHPNLYNGTGLPASSFRTDEWD